jgi:nitrate/nitrite transport system substrate-binding protein
MLRLEDWMSRGSSDSLRATPRQKADDKDRRKIVPTSKTGSEPEGCSRREFIKQAAGSIVGAVSLPGWLTRPAFAQIGPPRTHEVTIGTFGPSHCATSVVFSSLRGFFKSAGVNARVINYDDMRKIAADLMNGSLDFGQLVVPLVLAMHTGAAPFHVSIPMAVCQIGGTNGAALMVRRGAEIHNPEDFKGKVMANHSTLSVHYLITMMFLETHGLSYQKDVNFKSLKLDDVLDAVGAGQVDSFVMPEPKNALAELKGIADVFLLSKYIWPNHPCCAFVARKDFFEKNRELVADVFRVTTRGALYVNRPDTRDEVVDVIRSVPDFNYDKVPRAALLKAFTPGRSDFFPFPYGSSGQLIAEIMKKYQLLPPNVDEMALARDVFQSDLSRKLIVELGEEAPESNYRVEKVLGNLKSYSD